MATHAANGRADAQQAPAIVPRVDHSHINAMNRVAGATAAKVATNAYADKVASEKGNAFFSQASGQQDAGQAYRSALVDAVTMAKPSAASKAMVASYNAQAPTGAQVPRIAESIIADVAARVAKTSPFATPLQRTAADRYARGEVVRLDELATPKGIVNIAVVSSQYVKTKMLGNGSAVDAARQAAFEPTTRPA